MKSQDIQKAERFEFDEPTMIGDKLLMFDGMTRVTLRDGTVSFVPNHPGNRDYVELQWWLDAGNQIDLILIDQ
jgi:hypothetical protein